MTRHWIKYYGSLGTVGDLIGALRTEGVDVNFDPYREPPNRDRLFDEIIAHQILCEGEVEAIEAAVRRFDESESGQFAIIEIPRPRTG